MKPFFSIRIEFNPADSEDETHRDCFAIRKTIARQITPCPTWGANAKKCKAQLREDTEHVVQAITSSIEELSRDAKWTLPDLIEDIVFELANGAVLEEQVLRLAGIAVPECSDEFLDQLQKIIDSERAKTKPEPQA
jgi:hypothetical protein